MASSVMYSTCHVGTFCCYLTHLDVYIRNFSHCHTNPSLSPSLSLWCPSQQFPYHSPVLSYVIH